MTDNQNRIALWLTLAGKKAPDKLEVPNKEFAELWKKLMLEEVEETYQAMLKGDIVETIDGAVDCDWVLNNLTHKAGMLKGGIYQKAFTEVDNSNFSKYCKTEEEAVKSVKHYAERTDDKQCEAYYKQVGNYWVIFRKSDDKILKSVNYKPADIKSIVDEIN